MGNFTGDADFLHQREVLAGSPKIYAQLVPLLQPYSRVIASEEQPAEASSAPKSPRAIGDAPF